MFSRSKLRDCFLLNLVLTRYIILSLESDIKLREKNTLRMFQNRVLRKILENVGEEVTGH
jgi:hypothetical protein